MVYPNPRAALGAAGLLTFLTIASVPADVFAQGRRAVRAAPSRVVVAGGYYRPYFYDPWFYPFGLYG